MSPSRFANSSYIWRRWISRISCIRTCLAVWAAMRPKSSGRGVPLAGHVALEVQFETPDLDLTRLGIDLDFGVLGGVGTTLVRGEQRVGQSDEQLPLVNVLVTCNLSQGFKKFEVRHD